LTADPASSGLCRDCLVIAPHPHKMGALNTERL